MTRAASFCRSCCARRRRLCILWPRWGGGANKFPQTAVRPGHHRHVIALCRRRRRIRPRRTAQPVGRGQSAETRGGRRGDEARGARRRRRRRRRPHSSPPIGRADGDRGARRARQPARAAVARREDKANKLEHFAPRTYNTEKRPEDTGVARPPGGLRGAREHSRGPGGFERDPRVPERVSRPRRPRGGRRLRPCRHSTGISRGRRGLTL